MKNFKQFTTEASSTDLYRKLNKEFDFPYKKVTGTLVASAKTVSELGKGVSTKFEVYTTNAKSGQDQFAMYIHGPSLQRYLGTHPSKEGALKLAKSHGFID